MVFRVKVIILIGFILRLFVAIWNGFYGPSPGADLDAVGINGFALKVGETGLLDDWVIGYIPYTNILGIVYHYTINHVFIGSLLSCIAWLLSAFFFYLSIRFFITNERVNFKILVIYSLLPSSIFLTSVTLREPYQLLFINIAIYAFLKVYISNASRYFAVLILSLVCAGSLHGGLFAFGLYFFSVGVLMYTSLRKKNISSVSIYFFGIILLLLLIQGIILFSGVAYSLDGGIEKAIDNYQMGLLGVEARANYRSQEIDKLYIFIPLSILQYLFEPLPWRIGNLSDFILCAENIIRGWLIWKILRGINSVKFGLIARRRAFYFMVISYFAMEIIWSAGTINWGTAVRHHIPAFGLLLLAACIGFVDNLDRISVIRRNRISTIVINQ